MINLEITDSSIEQCINKLGNKYQVLDIINLDEYSSSITKLHQKLYQNYRDSFQSNQKIILQLTEDYYDTNKYGILLKSVQAIINKVDISNFFIALVTTNEDIDKEYQEILDTCSTDLISFEVHRCKGSFTKLPGNQIQEVGQYNVLLTDTIDDYAIDILDTNKNFCIMPWIQTQTRTSGLVYPCCLFDRNEPLGNSQDDSLETIFNNQKTRQLRLDMLANKQISRCDMCNLNENSKKSSQRRIANNKYIKHLQTVKDTKEDGSYPYKHIAWDIRFNNLCNLKCRTCNHVASSSWFSDSLQLPGNKDIKQVLSPSGIFEQYLQHIDHVEQIYFAGGEPLIIKECWDLLDELINHNRLDVELVYNTNFTRLKFKGKSIFEYWKQFKQVHVGASLDAMGERAEYWRSGTNWKIIEENRVAMLNEVPNAGFSIDATVSLVNALHVVDFHRDWVSKGLITPDQFNPKALTYPAVFSLHQAPTTLKKKIYDKISKHLDWLAPLDKTEKSTFAFKSIITALDLVNKEILFDADGFWEKINQIDAIRNEKLIRIFPELECIKTSTDS